MAATLKSILGDEVNLPHDLLPDDTTVIYDKKENPVDEMDFDDPDDERLADSRAIERYKALVLAYYNGIHHTDYMFGKVTHVERSFENSTLIHFGFTASPSRAAAECESAADSKQFCAKLQAPLWSEGEEVVTSCSIVDGPKICEDCYHYMQKYEDSSETRGRDKKTKSEEVVRPLTQYSDSLADGLTLSDKAKSRLSLILRALADVHSSKTRGRDKDTESEEVVPPLSQYSHLLADGVTLSDKAKLRLPLILRALAYYNKKQHADYKLVDGLPYYFSLESSYGMLYHLNFIARQNKCDASNKLFFAEFHKPNHDWVVTACCVVRGKTTAGCHAYEGRCGKRVVHPTRGYRFGLYPRRFGSCRSRR